MIKIHQIYTYSPLRNYTYLIEGKDQVFSLDPYGAEQLIQKIEQIGKPLAGIINSHEHFDHTEANLELVMKFNCPVYAHTNAVKQVPKGSHALKDEDLIELGQSYCLKIWDTPGHTMKHICLLLVNDEKIEGIFTGDTLFNAGVGNCHNGGDPKILFETIHKKIQSLKDEVFVYPGHDYYENNLNFTMSVEPDNLEARKRLDEKHFEGRPVLNLGEERKINSFLRLESASLRENLDAQSLSEKELFLKLRQMRNNW